MSLLCGDFLPSVKGYIILLSLVDVTGTTLRLQYTMVIRLCYVGDYLPSVKGYDYHFLMLQLQR